MSCEAMSDHMKLAIKTISICTLLFLSLAATAEMKLYYVHNDHLNTPQLLTDENQNVVWAVESQTPFGEVVVNEDPDGDGESVVFNVRFPGQYFDEETGLSYNYFRTYDASLGRYVQSDPIGLRGGINTFSYVQGNPLGFMDPFGLFTLGDARASLRSRGVRPERRVGRVMRYTDSQVFDEWLRLERANIDWLAELVPCPRRVEMCESPTWAEPSAANSQHPGGVLATRSTPTEGGHANQCVYDENGDIMTNIPAAGSADYVAHGFNTGHFFHDLQTWWLARDLNRREDYYNVRPVVVEAP